MSRLRWILQLPYAIPAGVYTGVCVALWPIPVLGILHVQSSAIIAGIAFFGAGLSALALLRRGESLAAVATRHVALLALPLLLLTVTLLWRANCGYFLGLLLFGTFVLPSVALGVSLAYALDTSGNRLRFVWFVATGFVLATLPVVYDLGLHPQLYTYNHVWGGVLGPIYDEELAVRPGLFFFRGLTLWWAAALVFAARRARMRGIAEFREEGRRHGLALLGVALMIAGTYAATPWLGINTPSWYVQQRLGGHLELDRFDIYYDPASISDGELRVIADEHRFRYSQLRGKLGAEVPHRIATYLYPDTRTKAALTGSRTTSVVPTWLRVPQMHILQSRFEGSFAHELAHVIAREFGMPVIRASPAIGLVEGLAVAVEPPDGLPSLHAQVAEGLRHREELGIYGDSLAAVVTRQLRPFGFWTARGAVSYTTMGSFVRYLLDNYGPEKVQAAYRTGRFASAFDEPLDDLARRWEAYIRTYPEDAEAAALVMDRFSRPSLFEQRCPHYVPPVVRHLRRGHAGLDEGDILHAEEALHAALAADSMHQQTLVSWARLQLAHGDVDPARQRLERAAATLDARAGSGLLTRLGDARRLTGDDEAADTAYAAALDRLPLFADQQRVLLLLRARLPAETIAALLEVAPLPDRARDLESVPLGSPFAAFEWARAGEHARAADLMEASIALLPAGQRLAWQSRFAHLAGNRGRAAVLAEQAATAFEGTGAGAVAAQQRDRASLLWWHVLREATPDG
jgi:tetratricopeptide (TPR) repeat protein